MSLEGSAIPKSSWLDHCFRKQHTSDLIPFHCPEMLAIWRERGFSTALADDRFQ